MNTRRRSKQLRNAYLSDLMFIWNEKALGLSCGSPFFIICIGVNIQMSTSRWKLVRPSKQQNINWTALKAQSPK